MKYIGKDISKRVLFLGVSMKTKGGMTAVLVSYKKYIDGMQFIPTWRLGNKFSKLLYACQAIVRMWLKCKFDKNIEVVHIHGAANASFSRCKIFINLARNLGKKVILHEHAADFIEFYNNAENKSDIIATLNKCDKLIVLSRSWKTFFISIGVPTDRISVLNNIVSPPDIKPVKHNSGKLHLLYMGEISNRKGVFDLLKAVDRGKEFFKDRLALRIGGNEVDGDIRAFIKDNGLADFVNYDGWISGEYKINCLNWEDVYILPSYNEGLPIAILEAMSYSHPVISTPVGGIPEVVIDHENGILVTPGDIEEIKMAIQYYIDNKETIMRHGEKGYEIVKDFFPEKVFNDLKSIYLSLLQ